MGGTNLTHLFNCKGPVERGCSLVSLTGRSRAMQRQVQPVNKKRVHIAWQWTAVLLSSRISDQKKNGSHFYDTHAATVSPPVWAQTHLFNYMHLFNPSKVILKICGQIYLHPNHNTATSDSPKNNIMSISQRLHNNIICIKLYGQFPMRV